MYKQNIIRVIDEHLQNGQIGFSVPSSPRSTAQQRASSLHHISKSGSGLLPSLQNSNSNKSINSSRKLDELLSKVKDIQQEDFSKRVDKVLKRNDGRDISNLFTVKNLKKTTQNQTLNSFYLSSRQEGLKNNFYSKIAIAQGGSNHNLYNDGIKSTDSISMMIKDIDLNQSVMKQHQRKFQRLDPSEYALLQIARILSGSGHSNVKDFRSFVKPRKEVADLIEWVQSKFKELGDASLKVNFEKKLSIMASAFGELSTQVSRDCKERGTILREIFQIMVELYHSGFNQLEQENFAQSEEYLKQQGLLHRVYQQKLADQSAEIDKLKSELQMKLEIVDHVVKDDRYLRKKIKKLERILRQQNHDLTVQKKEYAELYKENIRLLMRYFDIDEITAKELKREYRKLNEDKIAQLNLKLIDDKVHKSVQKQFTERQVQESVRNYADLQDLSDDLSDSDQEVKVQIQELTEIGTQTEDLIKMVDKQSDTYTLVKFTTIATQYKFEVETNSIGVQEKVKTSAKFTSTFISTMDEEVQAQADTGSQTTQTVQMMEELKREFDQIDEASDEDEVNGSRQAKHKISILEQEAMDFESKMDVESKLGSILHFEDEVTKLDERSALISANTQTLMQLSQKRPLEQSDIKKIQQLVRTNQNLTHELFNAALSSLHMHKKSLFISSERKIQIDEQSERIQRQQLTLDFLRKDLIELQELNADMNSTTRSRLEGLITNELKKLEQLTQLKKPPTSPSNFPKRDSLPYENDFIDESHSNSAFAADASPKNSGSLDWNLATRIPSQHQQGRPQMTPEMQMPKRANLNVPVRIERPLSTSKADQESPKILKQKVQKTTQVISFNFADKKKKVDKFSLQAEHQHRASQLMYEAMQTYQPSQLIMKNKVKVLTTLLKTVQPLFSDLFRMTRKQEEFRYPVHVFLYTSFINKYGLMKVSEKNFLLTVHQLYQCQTYTPTLTFLARLMGLNMQSHQFKSMPREQNVFDEMLLSHGYIHSIVFKWLTMLDDTTGQNTALERLQTSAQRLVDLINKLILPDFEPAELIERYRNYLQWQEVPFVHQLLYESVANEYPINLFNTGCLLYQLALEIHGMYENNVTYLFSVVDLKKVNVSDFKTVLDTFEPRRRRSPQYLDILMSFIYHSDTSDEIEKQHAMTLQRLTTFCWMNRLFSSAVTNHIRDTFKKMQLMNKADQYDKIQQVIRSFKWFLFQNNCFSSTYQKLLSFIQIQIDRLNTSQDDPSETYQQLQLCEYIMLTRIEQIKYTQACMPFISEGYLAIGECFKKLVHRKSLN